MRLKSYLISFIFLLIATLSKATAPVIGAQIWLEPGHTPEHIDRWFAILAENKMPVTRLFVMWNFIETKPNVWDFSLYDNAFKSAEKHQVKIVATLMPNMGPPHRGFYYKVQDGAIPKTQAQLSESYIFIEKLVNRYKNSSALQAWMLMNEPGQFPVDDPIAMDRYKVWLEGKYGNIEALNKAFMTDFKSFKDLTYSPNWAGGGFTWPTAYVVWQQFWREHLTWYMNDVADQIRKHDTKSGVHINPHGLLDITSKYDLPKWRSFLTSLGCSIHPVWHFDMFKREQYALGVNFINDMIRGAAEPNPYWVTELQGGHNIYTGTRGIIPQLNELQAWLWGSVASGAENIIYWCLNQRGKGTEAGEWGMLDYDGLPTDRIRTTKEVAENIEANKSFFDKATPAKDEITIILSPETMIVQERMKPQVGDEPARGPKAHKEEAIGVYMALQSAGFIPQIKFFDDYNWLTKSGVKRCVILPHTSALTNAQIEVLKGFVENGGKLIATGLTGYYDEEERCRALNEDFLNIKGLKIKEVLTMSYPDNNLIDNSAKLPVCHLSADIRCDLPSSKSIDFKGKKKGVKLNIGKGELVWIASNIGQGYFNNTSSELGQWFNTELTTFKTQKDLSFGIGRNVNYKVLESNGSKLQYISNFSDKSISLKSTNGADLSKSKILSGTLNKLPKGGFEIPAKSALVILK